MRAHPRLYLTAIVLISAACGGRMAAGGDDAGEGATGSGGGSNGGVGTSQGARPTGSGGKATGIGGKATGTGGKATGIGGKAGVGGTVGVGGVGPCLGIPCPAVDCAPGFVPIATPDACCGVECRPLCQGVACPAIACGSGSHLEIVPGQCCPSCVQDSCEAQRAGYQQFRQQLIDKYSGSGCMIDGDCSIYYEKNACAVGCGIPVPSQVISSLDSNLQSYAQLNCSPNCAVPIPPCEPTLPPTCFKGWCE